MPELSCETIGSQTDAVRCTAQLLFITLRSVAIHSRVPLFLCHRMATAMVPPHLVSLQGSAVPRMPSSGIRDMRYNRAVKLDTRQRLYNTARYTRWRPIKPMRSEHGIDQALAGIIAGRIFLKQYVGSHIALVNEYNAHLLSGQLLDNLGPEMASIRVSHISTQHIPMQLGTRPSPL